VKADNFLETIDPTKAAMLLRTLGGYQGTLLVTCVLRLAPVPLVRAGKLRKADTGSGRRRIAV
jgi:hypothetical protein